VEHGVSSCLPGSVGCGNPVYPHHVFLAGSVHARCHSRRHLPRFHLPFWSKVARSRHGGNADHLLPSLLTCGLCGCPPPLPPPSFCSFCSTSPFVHLLPPSPRKGHVPENEISTDNPSSNKDKQFTRYVLHLEGAVCANPPRVDASSPTIAGHDGGGAILLADAPSIYRSSYFATVFRVVHFKHLLTN
jgi:hypothetical protein